MACGPGRDCDRGNGDFLYDWRYSLRFCQRHIISLGRREDTSIRTGQMTQRLLSVVRILLLNSFVLLSL